MEAIQEIELRDSDMIYLEDREDKTDIHFIYFKEEKQ